jgi:hypothetical protein
VQLFHILRFYEITKPPIAFEAAPGSAAMTKSIYRDEYRILIDLLRNAREQARVSQGAVAQAFEWPQSTLSHLERGSRRIDVVEFVDYCRIVGADPRELFDEFLKRSDRLATRLKREPTPAR